MVVSFSGVEVPIQPLPASRQETGIDGGRKVFLSTAQGAMMVAHPHHYRRGEKRLAKAQKRLSRRKKGSTGPEKARGLVAKHPQTVGRQRRDFQPTTARTLVTAYDAIELEDLRVANLVRNHQLAKRLREAGWGQFRTILEAQAADAGRQVTLVPPASTTQDCSACGERVPKSLSVRTHGCPSCGFIADRDLHAAWNMLRAGQARRGAGAVVSVSKREAPSL